MTTGITNKATVASKFAAVSGGNINPGNADSKNEDKDTERCIKGIPIRSFIDEIKKQDKARREAQGTLDDYPI